MKTLVFGATGLLGREVFRELRNRGISDLHGTSTKSDSDFLQFNVLSDDLFRFLLQHKPTHIVNCIGRIPQNSKNLSGVEYIQQMFKVNSIFPRRLSTLAVKFNAQLIQIRTDCVYSGISGDYKEDSLRSPRDIYGISKALGEVTGFNQQHIRSSIVGYHPNDTTSLFGWFRNLPDSSIVDGYTNHLWNGVPTSIFARLSSNLLLIGGGSSFQTHLVPANGVSKYEMLLLFKKILGRYDIKINPVQSPKKSNRTLNTMNPKTNRYLWELAGYDFVPKIEFLLEREISAQIESQ